MAVADRVRAIVAPLLADEGLECFDVEYGGGRLAVLVDRPGGVDLDAVTHATHLVSAALDREDPLPGSYVLEVSSPGLERRLRTPQHFHQFVGSAVSIKTTPQATGDRRVKGTLTAADDDGVTVDGRRLRYDEIERAQTVFEWGPPPKAQSPKAQSPKAQSPKAQSPKAQSPKAQNKPKRQPANAPKTDTTDTAKAASQ